MIRYCNVCQKLNWTARLSCYATQVEVQGKNEVHGKCVWACAIKQTKRIM